MLERHAVAVRDGRIEAVLPADAARNRFADFPAVELPEHALIPGLVNAHTHAAMSLMRGIADDMPLMRWLQEHIWPAEAKHVSPHFVRDGTLLACAEMLRGGTTCFNDMYFYPEAAVEAALDAGMRASLGAIVIDFPSPYAADPDDYLRKGLALRDRFADQPAAQSSAWRRTRRTRFRDETFGQGGEDRRGARPARARASARDGRRGARAPSPSMAPGRWSACAAWVCSVPD